MVRARTNRVVMSQRDIRQTTGPEPTTQPAVAHNIRSTLFCTWCRANGRQYACLGETPHASCVDAEGYIPTQEWTSSAMNSEGWVPTSGPCCEDCLEAAFEQRGGGSSTEVGKLGRDLVVDVHTWCTVKGGSVRHSAQKGWKFLCGWLERAKQRWRPRNNGDVKVTWGEVTFEAEGYLEVKVVVSRDGVMQHLEIDLPSEVHISLLKTEMALLIDVNPEKQQWFYQAQPLDDSKTLDEQNVNIGAVIEVKCQT
ncbi:hypothetical protein ACOMHN_052108 [Nucella lapillus]